MVTLFAKIGSISFWLKPKAIIAQVFWSISSHLLPAGNRMAIQCNYIIMRRREIDCRKLDLSVHSSHGS